MICKNIAQLSFANVLRIQLKNLISLVHGQLKYFNETTLKLERQKTSAVDVVIVLTELKLNLHEKRICNLVPQQAKRILEKLEKDGEVDARFFLMELYVLREM